MKNSGFTLLELMMAVTILGILAVFAAPDFRVFIERQKIKSSAETISSILSVARAEALTRLADISVCWVPSSNSAVTVRGYRINPGNMAVLTAANPAVVISDLEFDNGTLHMVDDEPDNCVAYDAQGRLDEMLLRFAVCSESGEDADSRSIVATQVGRAVIGDNEATTVLTCA